MVTISIETAEKILSYFKLQYGKDMESIPVMKTLIQAVKDAKEEDNARTKYMDQMEAENAGTILHQETQGRKGKTPEKS